MTTYDLPIWDELAAELGSEPSRRSPSRRRSGRPAPHATTAPCGVRGCGCGGARVEPCGCDHEETTDMTITITPEIQAAANSYRDAIDAAVIAWQRGNSDPVAALPEAHRIVALRRLAYPE